MDNQTVHKSSLALVTAAWLVVVIPAGWGLNYTVQNALKIFTKPAPAVTAPVVPAPAATPAH